MKALKLFIAVLLALASSAALAQKQITDYTGSGAAQATDALLAERAGAYYSMTAANMNSYITGLWGANCATFMVTPSGANLAACLTTALPASKGGTGLTSLSANTVTFLGAADYAAMRTDLGLDIGTNVQAYDADLTTWAGITPGANVGTALAIAIGSAGAPALDGGGAKTAGDVAVYDASGRLVDGAAPLTSYSFNTGSSRNLASTFEIYVCTTTCTITPPATLTAGSQFCVQNDDNVSTVITLAAVAAVQYEATARTSYGTANHTMTSGGAVKDQICFVAVSTTKYNVFSSTGTWTNN